MKLLLKIVLGIMVFGAAVVGIVFYATSGLVDAADGFFTAVRKQDFAAAHSYLSEDFKANTNVAALQQFLTSNTLLRYEKASWSNRQFANGRGSLEGEIITTTGGVVPLKLSLVKESSAWKIYGIQKPTAGLQTSDTSQNVPSEVERMVLAKRSMHDFAVSVNEQSMRHFHSSISQLWQREFSPEKLDSIFGSLYEKDVNWLVLDAMQPTLEPVTGLGEDDDLILVGRYKTKPRQLLFTQKYIYEGIDWKLYGFEVKFQSPASD